MELPNNRLIKACIMHDKEMIVETLEQGADPNRAYSYGGTPLYWTAIHCDTTIAKILLSKGADPLIGDINDGSAPLLRASYHGSINMVILLLKAGADINQADKYGNTPLNEAIKKNHKKIIKLLNNVPVVLSLRLLCLNIINIKQVPIPDYFPEWLLDYDNYEL
jgi:ankyrin repeat protein